MFLGVCFEKIHFLRDFCQIDDDGDIMRNLMVHHSIKLKNVMAIKAFCEKLMAITDGPSLMDHHRHVCMGPIEEFAVIFLQKKLSKFHPSETI